MSTAHPLVDQHANTGRISHGTLTYLPSNRGVWVLRTKPNIAIKAKRLFARASVGEQGKIHLQHSYEVARDLEWFLERYPHTMSTEAATILHQSADGHRDVEDKVAAIIAGTHEGAETVMVPGQKSRDYQLAAADLVSVVNRTLITDALGLGKTHSGALTFRNPGALPGLVVPQTHLPSQWVEQLGLIWPGLRVYVPNKGTPDEGHLARFAKKHGGPPDVYVVPYSKMAGWQHHLRGVVKSVVLDEVQELRNGVNTNKGVAIRNVATAADYCVGLTATPVTNYGGDLHSIYEVVSPGSLGGRDEFLREWGGSILGMGGKHMTVKDPQALGQYLRDSGLMIGRTRAEVGRELPYGAPVKITHAVDADEKALERIEGNAVELAKLILSQTSDSTQRFTAAGQLDILVRQATGIAKAPFVAQFVTSLIQSESAEKIVVWGWHHAVYFLWREQFTKHNISSVQYTGQESVTQKNAALASFKDPNGAQVLIMSLRSGAGIDGLQEVCHTGVFGELDWSPKTHDQCAGRLARDGQEAEVLTYYMLAESGSDPEMRRALDLKQAQAVPIETPDAMFVSALPDNKERMRALALGVLERAGVATTAIIGPGGRA